MNKNEKKEMTPDIVPKRVIVFGGGGAGGMGKTTCAVSSIDWFYNRDIPFHAFDVKSENKAEGKRSL